MAIISHQDNFATNLTSNTNAGDTTSPLNSIPTVDAPFYIAFDATNSNGHYELAHITSKTATNVNHASLTYAHTTAEEVRLVLPSRELDLILHSPQGYLRGGKLSVTVASNNLTVALKTIAGADPSVTDPVSVRIGDTELLITSALSVTKNAGTNWFNAGSSELATKEIDYFVYLGYNATDGITIGFSRFPGASQYGDFSSTSTNEKYCAISTITNAASTDYYDIVGRFAATLSAGAGYTWTVPTFTAINLIQRPIYETRWLSWVPTVVGFSSIASSTYNYKLTMADLLMEVSVSGTSNATNWTMTMPFINGGTANTVLFPGNDNGAGSNSPRLLRIANASNIINLYATLTNGNWTSSGNKGNDGCVIKSRI